MQQLRLAGERGERQACRQRGRRLLRLSGRLYGQLPGQDRTLGGNDQSSGSSGHPQVRPDGERRLARMTLDAWLGQSTQASGVPLKVTDPAILLDVAAQIAHTKP